MRNISASLTRDQIVKSVELVKQGKDPLKTVTRRLGWKNLKPGERLQVVNKCQGLKAGEHPIKLAVVEVVNVRRERLHEMTNRIYYGLAEVRREGFHHLTPHQFVAMFCKCMKCKPSQEITRIEWGYLVDVEVILTGVVSNVDGNCVEIDVKESLVV